MMTNEERLEHVEWLMMVHFGETQDMTVSEVEYATDLFGPNIVPDTQIATDIVAKRYKEAGHVG